MKRLLGTALVTLCPAMALAEEVAIPEGCELLDASEVIRVLVCAGPLDKAALAQAGRAACGDVLPCGAWIWADAADAPVTAPANHDGLTQAQVTASRGVWVAEAQQFITIEPVTD